MDNRSIPNTSLAELSKKILSPTDYRIRFLEPSNNYAQHNKIYTDGSKTDTGAGYAIITEKAKKKKKKYKISLFHHPSSQPKLMPSWKPLNMHRNNEDQIVIYTDFMSVTKSLTKSYDQENQLISTIQN